MMILFANNSKIELKVKKLLPLIFLCIFIGSSLQAQDINLTQFNYSPLLVNPANTGNFYGDWRLGLNYRNQWASTGTPYSTAVLNGDKVFHAFGKKIGGGILFVSDQSEGISRNKLYLSGSYIFELNENHFSAGLQAGMVFSSPNTKTWGVWDPVSAGFTGTNGEISEAESGNYIDINLGLLWKRKINIFEPEVGAAFSHLNMPNESYMAGDNKVPITSSFHAGVKTNLNDNIYILPTGLFSNSKNNTVLVAGMNAGYKLLGNRSSVKEVFGGVYVRNANELNDINILLGTTVGRLDIVVSYDMNTSGLSQSQNTSSFEISLIYKSISTILNSYSIPCERF